MPQFTVIIPVIPTPQARHRSRIAGSAGKQFVQTYKSSKQRIGEDNLREMLYKKLSPDFLFPIQTALELHVMACLPIPASWSKKKLLAAMNGELKHTTRPDADNLLKELKDVCTGVLYVDDRQIYRVSIEKEYSTEPGWVVTVIW